MLLSKAVGVTMRQIFFYFSHLWHSKIIRSLSRFTLIGSAAFILSILFNWNSPEIFTQARNMLTSSKLRKNSAIVLTNCRQITVTCPTQDLTYIPDELHHLSPTWLHENLTNYPYQILVNSQKQNEQNPDEIVGRIYYLDALLNEDFRNYKEENQGFNHWTTALFFTGGLTTWITLETFLSYRQKFKNQTQLELNNQLDYLKQKIEILLNDIEQIQNNLSNENNHKKELQLLIAAKNAELEQVRRDAQEFEQYVLAEYQILERENHDLLEENQELSLQIGSAKEEINHLQLILNELKLQPKYDVFSSDDLAEWEEEKFLLTFSKQARSQLFELAHTDQKKYKKVLKTLNTMSLNLRHHSLQTHEYGDFSGSKGEKVFESYVEHRTPGAWRIFWYYGPGQGFLTIYKIIPHP